MVTAATLAAISQDYVEQIQTTTKAIKSRWVFVYRKSRMIYLDLKDASREFFSEPSKPKDSKNYSFLDSLADISPLTVCYKIDIHYIQETYFGVAILMFALCLGGWISNLWSSFAYTPVQLSIVQALMIIALMPLKIWIGIDDMPVASGKRRSELFLTIFFMGFTMGRLCDYSVSVIMPQMAFPLLMALLVERYSSRNKKEQPKETHCKIKGSRLELFLLIASCIITTVWIYLWITNQLTFGTLLFSFLNCAINLHLLFVHFQFFFYGLYTVRERWNNETTREPLGAPPATLETFDPWIMNCDLGYALAALCLNVLISIIQY